MRKPLLILLALVTLLGAACGGDADPSDTPAATDPSPDTPTEEPCEDKTGDDVVTVEMGDNFFEPTCIVMVQSQGLHLENTGAVLHSFTIAPPVDFNVEPGKEFDATGPIPFEPRNQPYTYRCKYHAAMTGTLTIEEG